MRISFFLCLCICIISSCSQPGKTPAGILEPESMQSIYWDLIQADVYTRDFVTKDSSLDAKKEYIKLQNSIFSKHKIDRDAFFRSYDYYLRNPAKMENILDTITARNKRTKSMRDSLKLMPL